LSQYIQDAAVGQDDLGGEQRTSWKRALNGVGNYWSAGEPGRTTSPAIQPCSACQLGNDPVMANRHLPPAIATPP
jgi:hypothetical protein